MNYTKNYQLNQWEKTDLVLMEDFNADNVKIDAALAEIRTASPYIKLAEVTTQFQTSQIDLDVSGVDFSQYLKVELFVHSPNYTGGYSVQVNHIESGYLKTSCSGFSSGINGSSATNLASVDSPGEGMFSIYPPHPRGKIRTINWSISGSSSSASYNGYQYMAPCTWSELQSFNIRGYNFPIGTTVVLYGIKA